MYLLVCVLLAKIAFQWFTTPTFIAVILTSVGPIVWESVLGYMEIGMTVWQFVSGTITAPVKYVNGG